MGHLDNMIVKDRLGYQGRLADESVTIAEALKAAGYFTAMTGKWHLGQQHGTPPRERGFDRSLNSQAGGIYFSGQTGRENDRFFLNGRPLSLDSPRPSTLVFAGPARITPIFSNDSDDSPTSTTFGKIIPDKQSDEYAAEHSARYTCEFLKLKAGSRWDHQR